ncbi:MAG: peptidoglycan DD-metalloendopeptidase family protein [Desulfobacula sp.]|nr:peptidoglycan DD-metalloendopeptidase family protein [Desulfobacula sp.]
MLSILKTNIKIVFERKHKLQVSCKTVFLAGLITLLLSTALVFAQNSDFNSGIVNAFQLNIRKKPSLDSDVVVVVKQGATLKVLEIQGGIGGWLTVKYKGHKGYIRNRSQYIKLIKSDHKNIKQVNKNQKKQKLKAQIKTQKKMVATFSQKEIEIIEGLNEIDYTLNKARIKVMALSEEIMQLEEKIEPLNQAREQLGKAIILNRDYAGQRLRALYKMNMMGKYDSTGLPSSLFDFFLRQNSMKQIIKADFYILDRQNRDLEKFETVEQQLQKQIHAKTNLETQISDQIRINKKETVKRQLVLKEIRQKKRLSLAAVESLKQAALKLDNKITDMQKKGRQFIISDFSFSSYKGQLSIPVRGKIISKYGPSKSGDYKSFTFQKGIDIKVERGEPVKSVFNGEVMFAKWLKGYGNLLIINHGDNYYTLYAHVEEMFKQKGESVETGEVIATAGDTGSIKGMCLHFEVRHHGKPVNPMKWLKKGA